MRIYEDSDYINELCDQLGELRAEIKELHAENARLRGGSMSETAKDEADLIKRMADALRACVAEDKCGYSGQASEILATIRAAGWAVVPVTMNETKWRPWTEFENLSFSSRIARRIAVRVSGFKKHSGSEWSRRYSDVVWSNPSHSYQIRDLDIQKILHDGDMDEICRIESWYFVSSDLEVMEVKNEEE